MQIDYSRTTILQYQTYPNILKHLSKLFKTFKIWRFLAFAILFWILWSGVVKTCRDAWQQPGLGRATLTKSVEKDGLPMGVAEQYVVLFDGLEILQTTWTW